MLLRVSYITEKKTKVFEGLGGLKIVRARRMRGRKRVLVLKTHVNKLVGD